MVHKAGTQAWYIYRGKPLRRPTPNLQVRGTTYWLRVRVPDAIRAEVGRSEIKKSLGTSDILEAQQRARIERAKLDAEWDALKRRRAPRKMSELSDQHLWYLATKWFVGQEKRNLARVGDHLPLADAEADLAATTSWEDIAPAIYSTVETLLQEDGTRLGTGSPSHQKLQNLIHAAMIEAAKRDFRRAYPLAPVQISFDPQFASLSANAVLQPGAKSNFKTIIDKIKKDPARAPIRGKTLVKREAQWRLIAEFFGEDTALLDVSRDRVREFMENLARLPSNATKHFPKASMREAIALAEEKNLPRLSPDTANDYMRTLGGVFRYAMGEGDVERDPTAGLLIRAKKVRAKDKRLPFDTAELVKIFSAPIYTGCIDDRNGYAKAGPHIIRRGRFWVPLIALFTGMRLNEICQLSLDDFKVMDGTNLILIGGDDDTETKRVKTEAGNRFVPIHSELRRIGLLSYVEGQRQKAEPSTTLAELNFCFESGADNADIGSVPSV